MMGEKMRAVPELSHFSSQSPLLRVARFPGMRALAWHGDFLYASRGYELLRASANALTETNPWRPVGRFHASWRRRLSVANRLSARLFRDGFHALAALPSGELIAAVPGAIVALRPNESRFRVSHTITRGTRPLHITAVPGGAVYWGEYFDNASRDPVHVYGSTNAGETWSIAYTFPQGSIRHIHNIVHDPWADCLWVLTGDYGEECRILRVSCDFRQVETVMQGNQQARAVAAVPTEEGLYFSTDTPLEANSIYLLDREGVLTQKVSVSSSSIYGCRVGRRVFFSTMVEPSEVNRDREVRIYAGNVAEGFHSLLNWRKDRWPMGLFQYGNAFLPDGDNPSPLLAVSTIAVETDDLATSLFSIA